VPELMNDGGETGRPTRSILRSPLSEALSVSAGVTVLLAVIALALPAAWHTTVIGFLFLGATWGLVWRKDDALVRRSGLALGGLVIPGRLDFGRAARDAGTAIAWAAAFGAIVAGPFFLLWRYWWAPSLTFSLSARPIEAIDEVLGQVFVIALPEEAFYRGYLQSRLDDAWEPTRRLLGARVGPALVLTAAIFALGHVATVHLPARLAVFFPALLFGWLRARTGGIGASIAFHALCNVYSQMLGRGYGVY
jgi:membrane protease YdiL (CAAX protease family)